MSTKKMQLIGLKGKSAYQYAQDGGYTGTESEFKEKMAKELDAVYDYNDLNEKILASAIKPEASGTMITVSDAAALPLLSLDYEGENVTFTVSGKNLWPHGDIEIYEHERFLISLPAGTYMFSAIVDSTDTDASTCLVGSSGVIQRGTTRTSCKITLNSDITGIWIYASNSDTNDDGDTATFKDIQIEPGEVATDYEPYTAKTITVASPEEVNLNDFVMNYPNTVITNDAGAAMTVQYIADTQTYVDQATAELTNAVVSLGGEV